MLPRRTGLPLPASAGLSCLLINDVRMTTFTHQLLSRKIFNARSLTMQVRIFQPQCYVFVAVLRVGYAEVIFI